jgi:hypothetical protein
MRILFILCLLTLIGGSAWAATGAAKLERPEVPGRLGIVLLVALQR